MTKTEFAYAKTKAQIRCAVTDQRLCVLYLFTSYIRNFKLLRIFCGCRARFVSDLVEKKPKTGFLVTRFVI